MGFGRSPPEWSFVLHIYRRITVKCRFSSGALAEHGALFPFSSVLLLHSKGAFQAWIWGIERKGKAHVTILPIHSRVLQFLSHKVTIFIKNMS